jgi:PAS domain S-box-containing protein
MKRVPTMSPTRITVVYALGATIWILVSDRLVGHWFPDIDSMVLLQSLKGLAFVAVSSALLYSAVAFERRRVERVERARHSDKELIRLLTAFVGDVVFRYRTVTPRGFDYVSPAVTALTGHAPQEYYDDPDLGRRLVHDEDRAALAQHMEKSRTEPVVMRWKHRDGSTIWTEMKTMAVLDERGDVVAVEGIARDVTAFQRVNRDLGRALRDAEQAQGAALRSEEYSNRLREVITELVEASTTEEVLALITERAHRTAGSRSCIVGLVDPTGRYLDIADAIHGGERSLDEYQRIPLEEDSIPTRIVRTGETVWFRTPDEAEQWLPGARATFERFGSVSYAGLPLVVESRVIGALAFAYAEPHVFDESERGFLMAMAHQCAAAYERTRLREATVRSQRRLQTLSQQMIEAQENERRRIARELHDELGQLLGALNFNLHIAIEKQEEDGGSASAELYDSADLLDEMFHQVRVLSRELRPAILDDLGIGAAVDWLVERFTERSGLEIHFQDHIHPNTTVPPSIATTAYRIVQESLMNVTRHARARRVDVVLSTTESGLEIEIRDDGRGFDVAEAFESATRGTSLGLLSLSERAELVGGWTEIVSRTDGNPGTTVRAWLPLTSRALVS